MSDIAVLPRAAHETAGPGELRALRREQVGSVLHLLPELAAGNVVIAALVLVVCYPTSQSGVLLLWASAAVTAGVAFGWLARRVRATRWQGTSAAALDGITLVALGVGCLWGALPVIAFPSATGTHQLFLAGCGLVMLAGTLCALAGVPRAAFAWLTPNLLGALLAVLIVGGDEWVYTGLVLVCFHVALAIAVARFAELFRTRANMYRQLQESADTIALLLRDCEEHGSLWLWETDSVGRLRHVSTRFAEALGTHPAAVVGRVLAEVLQAERNPVIDAMARQQRFHDLTVALSVDGEARWWSMSGRPMFDDLGAWTGFRGFAADITGTREAEARVNWMAQHDPLTGLANRARFGDVLEQAARRTARYGEGVGLLMVDLDRFKLINDSKGHPFGDRLLREVAKRLIATVRDSDLVARLGGDEFAVVQVGAAETGEAARLADRIIEALSEPFRIEGAEVVIGASVGIALAPRDGSTVQQLMQRADLALYRAKEDGRGVARFFEPDMDSAERDRRNLELDLGKALSRGELVLHFQAQVDSASGRTTGFEALVRWHHPERGLLRPGDFLPVAERIGLMHAIGEWVINEACSAAAEWPEPIGVSVNLSPLQFERTKLVDCVRRVLEHTGLQPSRLTLEVGEGVLLQNSEDAVPVLTDLKTLGITLAMDDFGTGCSTLAHLWRLPFDRIKLDHAFVGAMDDDETVRSILHSIGSLGQSLSLHITAEGVETSQHLDFLKTLSVDQYQGYLFGQPVTRAEARKLAREGAMLIDGAAPGDCAGC